MHLAYSFTSSVKYDICGSGARRGRCSRLNLGSWAPPQRRYHGAGGRANDSHHHAGTLMEQAECLLGLSEVGTRASGTSRGALQRPRFQSGVGAGCEGKWEENPPPFLFSTCHRHTVLSCDMGLDGGRDSHAHSSHSRPSHPSPQTKGELNTSPLPAQDKLLFSVSDGHTDYFWGRKQVLSLRCQ